MAIFFDLVWPGVLPNPARSCSVPRNRKGDGLGARQKPPPLRRRVAPSNSGGEYNNPGAHSGLRLLDDEQRPFYRLAVEQAEAAYSLKARTVWGGAGLLS